MGKKRSSTVTSEDLGSGKVPHLDDDERGTGSGSSSKSFKKVAYAAKCVKPESNKPRIIKNLKQVTTAERLYPSGVASYGSIEMHNTTKPAKKYSDISGLPAKYTDPHTKLYYADAEEYARIRYLNTDQIAGYLSLRRANIPTP
ncbi:INO80 complex subunit C-like [Varroa jacobsoni]|uniref:Vps72/YL1 C-terminal domain-containing protein n=1 Tax=Varroa destructor TaxID=109461 RepID=A0A7M7J0G2_VARDE|nr:INO80 complex subunit C-like [Varroa destructor]XP_022695126.1 INO80 complex subunit C-like [Varroa jacobsoni]